jgi:DNA-binding MarR family transcriptional regulator
VHVKLTSAGNKAFQSIFPTAERHQERALRGFSAKEIESLIRYLHRIQANVEAAE